MALTCRTCGRRGGDCVCSTSEEAPKDVNETTKNLLNANQCESCARAGLDECGCPEPPTHTKLVLVSISAGLGRKISLFVNARVMPTGRYVIKESTFQGMLDEINVEVGETITT